jgi:hypothetical protein
MSERRGRQEKQPEDAVVTVAKALAPQMGSDPKHLSRQEIDQRKFAVLNEYTQAALAYFNWRGGGQKYITRKGKIKERRGIRFWRNLVDWELNTSPSLGGLGRRQIIQETAAAAGVGKGVLEVAQKPNVLARNITRRDWREKAAQEGKVVQE